MIRTRANLAMLATVRDFDLNDLRVFVRVVDRGGFAVAARELRVPTSTVSRTIGRLESRAGIRLLQRTSRSVRATSEGAALYASVREAITTLESHARALEPATRTPKGILRVTAPTEIGSAFLADLVVAFAERHPAVQVELSLTNRAVDLVAEGVDVAVRAAAKLDDSSLIAKKLGELEHGLYAAPRYLERRGIPRCPRSSSTTRAWCFAPRTSSRPGGSTATNVRPTSRFARASAATISRACVRPRSQAEASPSCRVWHAPRTKRPGA